MEPLSLVELLEMSIFESEVEHQYGAKFVKSDAIPADFTLSELHAELDRVVGLGEVEFTVPECLR